MYKPTNTLYWFSVNPFIPTCCLKVGRILKVKKWQKPFQNPHSEHALTGHSSKTHVRARAQEEFSIPIYLTGSVPIPSPIPESAHHSPPCPLAVI